MQFYSLTLRLCAALLDDIRIMSFCIESDSESVGTSRSVSHL